MSKVAIVGTGQTNFQKMTEMLKNYFLNHLATVFNL